VSEPLRTDRLVVRRFTSADVDDFCAYQADPRLRKFLQGAPHSAEEAARYLAAQAVLDERATSAWHGYAVQHLDSGKVIGDVGVYLVSAGEGDVGFQFHPAFHGQGYAREAMVAFLRYVFDVLGVEHVTAGCDQANTTSSTLLQRLGLHPRPASDDDGDLRFDLTRDEWRAQL
jgi:[ribosomal protein S5]-alanine N-acetyltransferase